MNEETTSADIAGVTLKLGQKREDILDYDNDIEEGYVHDDIIKDNIEIKFLNNHHSDDSFAECFDIEMLKSRIYAAYSRRAYNSGAKTGMEIYDINITKEDSTVDDIAYALNISCKHKHVWEFKEFAQHGTQVIFGTDDENLTVVIYQHFPRQKIVTENFISDFFKDLFKSKEEKEIIKKFKNFKESGNDLMLIVKQLNKKIKEHFDDIDKKEIFEFLRDKALEVYKNS